MRSARIGRAPGIVLPLSVLDGGVIGDVRLTGALVPSLRFVVVVSRAGAVVVSLRLVVLLSRPGEIALSLRGVFARGCIVVGAALGGDDDGGVWLEGAPVGGTCPSVAAPGSIRVPGWVAEPPAVGGDDDGGVWLEEALVAGAVGAVCA